MRDLIITATVAAVLAPGMLLLPGAVEPPRPAPPQAAAPTQPTPPSSTQAVELDMGPMALQPMQPAGEGVVLWPGQDPNYVPPPPWVPWVWSGAHYVDPLTGQLQGIKLYGPW